MKVSKKKITQKTASLFVVKCGTQPIFTHESEACCQDVKKQKEEELTRSGADISQSEHAVTITPM